MPQEKSPFPLVPFNLWYAAGSATHYGWQICVSADTVLAQTALNQACRGKRGPGYYGVSLVADNHFLSSVTLVSS